MSDVQTTLIKWRFLFEQFKVYLKVRQEFNYHPTPSPAFIGTTYPLFTEFVCIIFNVTSADIGRCSRFWSHYCGVIVVVELSPAHLSLYHFQSGILFFKVSLPSSDNPRGFSRVLGLERSSPQESIKSMKR